MSKTTRRWMFLCLLTLLHWGPTQHKASAQGGAAAEILQGVNQIRAEHGLPPYRYNGTLSIAAQNHANWMANNVIYSHTGAGGSSPQGRAAAAGYQGYVAENIVGGWHMTPRQGIIWWRNSSLHYSMMVSNRYTEAGVGYASNGTENMYVLVMGRPADAATIAAAPANEPQSEPLMVTPIELAQPREDGSIVHVVQEGQALWQIAAHYETTLQQLLIYNYLDEDDFIQPGDEILVRLAEGAPPPPTPTPPLAHTVREGENPWIIANRYSLDIDTFFYLNGLDQDSLLHPGNEVRIRLAEGEPPPPTPTPKLAHIVSEGDTLWSVAAQNGLSMDELLALNGISESTILQVGDELYVRATETPQPSPTPDVTATPTAQAPEATQASSLALAAAPEQTVPPPPTATPMPASEPRSVESGGASNGLLYVASILLAGVGLLLFVGVILRRP